MEHITSWWGCSVPRLPPVNFLYVSLHAFLCQSILESQWLGATKVKLVGSTPIRAMLCMHAAHTYPCKQPPLKILHPVPVLGQPSSGDTWQSRTAVHYPQTTLGWGTNDSKCSSNRDFFVSPSKSATLLSWDV